MRCLCECLLLALCLQGIYSALRCVTIPGKLAQIDAGNGQVFGVNKAGQIYTLYGSSLILVPGALTHVTVGPSGVWGVNGNIVFRLVGGNWIQISGSLKQIDAGGSHLVTGVNVNNGISCLSKSPAGIEDSSPLPWVQIGGDLKYYSCGPLGCWAVSLTGAIFYRHDIVPNLCAGSRWEQVKGQLSMIEVGTDSSVYGVNSAGHIYRRQGISPCNLIGTHWELLSNSLGKIIHVTYDLDILWALLYDGRIQKCSIYYY